MATWNMQASTRWDGVRTLARYVNHPAALAAAAPPSAVLCPAAAEDGGGHSRRPDVDRPEGPHTASARSGG